MKYWWLTNSKRLAAERKAVEALPADGWFELTRWTIWQGSICAEGVLLAHGHRYPVRLLYPDQFPEVPAWVDPQEDVRWSSHQFGKGTLCLELRPDNWNPSATGVDVLRSAHNLLMKENPLGTGGEAAPSAHQIGQVQSYGWFRNPLMIGTGCLKRIRAGTASGLQAVRWGTTDDIVPILVHDEVDRQHPLHAPVSDIPHARANLPVLTVHRPAPTSDDRESVVDATGAEGEFAALLKALPFGVIIFVDGETTTAFNLLGDGTFRRSLYVLKDDHGARSSRSEQAGGKHVTIIGCGSVGSKIADSVLRSGVTRLTLVDGDVFLPANIERHVLDWGDVGFRKVEALKRHLLAIAPGAEIEVIDDNLNWQRSAKIHARQVRQLAEGDVIVDATGDPATGLFLAAIADSNNKPFVSVEVFEGGIGALVAACLPGRDPPFVEGRATFLAWCEAQDVPPPPSGERRYEMLDDGRPVVADDASVTMTAGHATRVILDILDGAPPSSEAAWLLVGYSKHWIFDGHGHVVRLDVGRGSGRSPLEFDEEATAFVTKLLEETTGEAEAAQ